MTPTRSIVLGSNLPVSTARLNSAAAFSVSVTAIRNLLTKDGEFSQVMVSLLYASLPLGKRKPVLLGRECNGFRKTQRLEQTSRHTRCARGARFNAPQSRARRYVPYVPAENLRFLWGRHSCLPGRQECPTVTARGA